MPSSSMCTVVLNRAEVHACCFLGRPSSSSSCDQLFEGLGAGCPKHHALIPDFDQPLHFLLHLRRENMVLRDNSTILPVDFAFPLFKDPEGLVTVTSNY